MIKKLTKHLLVRYVISGGASAVVNLFLFVLLHNVWRVYYITASVIAFIVAFFVSLVLQKFWTFRDSSLHRLHHQAGKYLLTSLFGLLLNTLVVYICVDYFFVYAFASQVIAGALTACCTFFLSRHFVFKISEKDDAVKFEIEI